MAKKVSRRQRKTPNTQDSTITSNSKVGSVLNRDDKKIEASSLIYSYPLSAIKHDLVKSLVLFVVFITTVVALTATNWF